MLLTYVANVRLPTEKAHGLQIVQNCEALAAAGLDVTLVAPRRRNRPDLAGRDVWAHYGVPRSFAIRRLPCVDLFPLGRWFEPVSARLQLVTFTAAAALSGCARRADGLYSRDALAMLVVGWLTRATHVVYEAHQLASSGPGVWLERRALGRATLVIAVTEQLANQLRSRGGRRVIVLRDGFRADRFGGTPNAAEARRQAGVPDAAFCVGYVGQLQTLGMSKGLDAAVDAIARLQDPRVHLCLVGGPPYAVAALRSRWVGHGLSPDAFHAAGDIPPAQVPNALAAFDVAVMPLPWTPHFANCASPLKMFEYMAAGCPVVASDLPSISEVLRHDETALLVPPGDVPALAGALARLRDDAGLRLRLGTAARAAATAYSWTARAQAIVAALRG